MFVGFARIARSLNQKLEKDQPFEIKTVANTEYEALDELRQRLIRPPILAPLRNGDRYVLDKDACKTQVGCCLLQEEPEGDRRLIGYWSHSLTKPEPAYSTTKQDCLDIFWAINHL